MYALFLERMGKLYKPEKIKGGSVDIAHSNKRPDISTDQDRRKVWCYDERQPHKRGTLDNGIPGMAVLWNKTSSLQGPVTLTLDSRKFEYVEQPQGRKGSAKPSRGATPTPGSTTTTGPPET